jgi:hypothetical protein
MMDSTPTCRNDLQERTEESIDESVAIRRQWHGAANGRLRAVRAALRGLLLT